MLGEYAPYIACGLIIVAHIMLILDWPECTVFRNKTAEFLVCVAYLIFLSYYIEGASANIDKSAPEYRSDVWV